MSIPWCDGEPMDHTGVDIDTDVEFDTVFAFSMSLDSDVVPGAAVVGTESSAVNSNVHFFPSEKPGDPVHHLSYVGDGESFHPSLDHAMSWETCAVLFECLAVFYMCFNTVVGLVESYFKETSYSDGLRVVSFPSLFIGFPRWW